jgi:hypothetical protein
MVIDPKDHDLVIKALDHYRISSHASDADGKIITDYIASARQSDEAVSSIEAGISSAGRKNQWQLNLNQ